jgi:hypothetical protein
LATRAAGRPQQTIGSVAAGHHHAHNLAAALGSNRPAFVLRLNVVMSTKDRQARITCSP